MGIGNNRCWPHQQEDPWLTVCTWNTPHCNVQHVWLPQVAALPLKKDDGGPTLWAGGHVIPKAGGRCEDAFFTDDHGMGVVDGVAGMQAPDRLGANNALYAPRDVAERASVVLAQAESEAAVPLGLRNLCALPTGE